MIRRLPWATALKSDLSVSVLIRGVLRPRTFVDVIAVNSVKVPVMDIIHVVSVLDALATAAFTMLVVVVQVDIATIAQ